jgi:hypothetical protein
MSPPTQLTRPSPQRATWRHGRVTGPWGRVLHVLYVPLCESDSQTAHGPRTGLWSLGNGLRT